MKGRKQKILTTVMNSVMTNDIEQEQKQSPAGNSRFAKAGVSCFYESEVLNPNFVHLMKFSAENPRLRKAAKRWQ